LVEKKVFFISGGAGFIGTNLIRRIIEKNQVIVYDNLSRNSLVKANLYNHKNLTIIKGDILDTKTLIKAIPENLHYVIHMAAIAGIDTVIKNPVKTMEVNIIGTYNILKVLKEKNLIKKIEKFINFSTSEVFGISAFKVSEKSSTNAQPVGEARWSYSVSKLAGEHLTFSYYKQYGLPFVIIRPFNVYGPYQIGEGAIHHFITRAIKNDTIFIHGDGNQIRSWCYIDDMVDGILLCIEKKEANGEIFNIGNPKGTITVLGLAEKIVWIANSRSKIKHVEKKYTDVDLRIPSIEKAKKILNFIPKIDLKEGIERTIKWYKENVCTTIKT